ncbi:2'-5' RNA ligase [Candidatus Atribacteria bacterium RBG_19FT_COMBO_35_14]|uniref:RNA 2',3'-cyclic phosphodiesterase n=1 Tax=Candidatus Sediminicultor quintus TaxID=1797291 RepID=A0A1F5A876_9BACT|nr:MAG: 2'-5' RNA ligase [Candidatus Atribacteria bacterium RBG_19FT_COMBO_35_14]
MNLEKVRLFIAVNLSPKIKEYLISLQTDLSIPETKIKWVEKNNLHLTMKFLGYISLEQRELIKSILKDITYRYSPFNIKLSSDMGIFPTGKMPRIIWVGIKEGISELKGLYSCLENILSHKGFPREDKDFTGHITIGRVKFIGEKTNFIQIVQRISINNLSQEVGSIDLMESKLTPNGPLYNLTAKFPLLK